MDDNDSERMMTVSELLTELAKVDPAAPVLDAPNVLLNASSGMWVVRRVGRSAKIPPRRG